MKLGSCPNCGSHSVRAGRAFLLHLARLAHGTHRRYCCICRNRWTASEKVYLPWARRLGVFLMCAVVGLALACVVNEVWLSPRPCPPQTAAWAEERAGGADSFPGWDRPAAYGLSGMGFAGQDYARMRGSAGQSLAHSASYRRGMQGIFRQYGPPRDMSEVLVQAAAVIRPMGKTPGQFASEIENSDRQTLWNKYGNNFSSKEEAKAAYDEFKRRRSEIPNDWPDSVK